MNSRRPDGKIARNSNRDDNFGGGRKTKNKTLFFFSPSAYAKTNVRLVCLRDRVAAIALGLKRQPRTHSPAVVFAHTSYRKRTFGRFSKPFESRFLTFGRAVRRTARSARLLVISRGGRRPRHVRRARTRDVRTGVLSSHLTRLRPTRVDVNASSVFRRSKRSIGRHRPRRGRVPLSRSRRSDVVRPFPNFRAERDDY